MKDVVYMSAEAWDDLPSTTLVKSWNKLLRGGDDNTSTTDEIQALTTEFQPLLAQLHCNSTEEEIRTWLSGSEDIFYKELTDEEILQKVKIKIQCILYFLNNLALIIC